MAREREQVRYPASIIAGVAAAILVCLWGAFQSYGLESAYQRQSPDPYQISAQFVRLGPVFSAVPENAVMGYVTDADTGSVTDTTLLTSAEYVLAPRLVTRGTDHDWVLGNWRAAGGLRHLWTEPRSPPATGLRQRRGALPEGTEAVTALLWVLDSVLLGCLLVYRWTDLRSLQPQWAAWLLIFGTGAAGGIGATSCLFLVCGVVLGSPTAAMVVEIALLAWCAYDAFRHRARIDRPSTEPRTPIALPWIAGALLLALGIGTAAMAVAWDMNPQGNWDAWAIWNLRAKFLASPGGLATRAWSPVLAATSHPSYPLLISDFVGRDWAFSQSLSHAAPLATAYIFFTALIALVAGGLAILRGPTLGLLGALVLAATPSLLREVPTQYADVPLGCYFAGAILFAMLDRPVLAGVFAGFAAWTKDEGLLVLVVVLAAILILQRRMFLWAVAGALPVTLLVVSFKILAGGGAPQLSTNPGTASHQLADVARIGTIAAAFGREFVAMGAGWYHPVLPLVILAVILRLDRERRREAIFCGAIAAALLIGFFGVYMVTANDLTWMLQTSLNRIVLQVWPALVLAGFLILRAPEAAAIVTRVPQPKERRKARA